MKRNNKIMKKLQWKELYFSLKNNIRNLLHKERIDSEKNRKCSALFHLENN